MAIVKSNFVRRGREAKSRAKATVRYIQHRPGKDHEKIARALFGNDGAMERADAYRMIDEAKKTDNLFRFVISPDPKGEDNKQDLNMRGITQQTMLKIEQITGRTVLWTGAIHADHSPVRHVHALAIVPGRLTAVHLQALTREATKACRAQRHELDLAQKHKQLERTDREEAEWGRGLLIFWQLRLALKFIFNWILEAIKQDNSLHRARFAKTNQVAGILADRPREDALLLGTRGEDFVCVTSKRTRSELGNLLVVAPTRGGKGLLAVSQLLSWKGSVIVNDIKGDLFTQTAGYRSTLGPVLVIDPTGLGHAFDPLHANSSEDEFYSSASHLLFQPNENEGVIFTQRAVVMLTQMFLAARLEKIAPLSYVRFMIRLGLADTAARLNNLSPELSTQFMDINFSKANLSDRFLLSAWGTLTARMRPLLTETVIRSLTRASFTPEQIICSPAPITLYLRWPERDLLALSPLVRLLWGAIISEMITTYDRKQGQGCNPVLLLVDEAGRTPIPMLADHASTVVGRKISLWIAVQSLSQLETVYGRARANTLRENMESQIFYRPSSQETAEYIERCLGRTSEYAHSQTEREGIKISQGLSEQGVPLMTAGEIKQMSDTETIAFHRNLPPMRLTRMDWRRSNALMTRRSIVPPILPTLAPLTDLQIRSADPLTQDSLIDPDDIPLS